MEYYNKEEKAQLIIDRLDKFARDFDHYEFGLPHYIAEENKKMLDIIISII